MYFVYPRIYRLLVLEIGSSFSKLGFLALGMAGLGMAGLGMAGLGMAGLGSIFGRIALLSLAC